MDGYHTSFREGQLPLSWKDADIVPVPQKRTIQDVNKHLRLIALTPILFKIAEDYVVHDFVMPAEKTDFSETKGKCKELRISFARNKPNQNLTLCVLTVRP